MFFVDVICKRLADALEHRKIEYRILSAIFFRDALWMLHTDVIPTCLFLCKIDRRPGDDEAWFEASSCSQERGMERHEQAILNSLQWQVAQEP